MVAWIATGDFPGRQSCDSTKNPTPTRREYRGGGCEGGHEPKIDPPSIGTITVVAPMTTDGKAQPGDGNRQKSREDVGTMARGIMEEGTLVHYRMRLYINQNSRRVGKTAS
jgi:hypothetical protein